MEKRGIRQADHQRELNIDLNIATIPDTVSVSKRLQSAG